MVSNGFAITMLAGFGQCRSWRLLPCAPVERPQKDAATVSVLRFRTERATSARPLLVQFVLATTPYAHLPPPHDRSIVYPHHDRAILRQCIDTEKKSAWLPTTYIPAPLLNSQPSGGIFSQSTIDPLLFGLLQRPGVVQCGSTR